MAALSAIRCNPHIRRFYERLCAAGKQFKIAIEAFVKLVTLLNTLLHWNREWQVEGIASRPAREHAAVGLHPCRHPPGLRPCHALAAPGNGRGLCLKANLYG